MCFSDNKPKPDTIEIFSVKIRENGTYKLIKMSLADIWNHGWELRINNFADKEKMPHNEKDIRNQVRSIRTYKYMYIYSLLVHANDVSVSPLGVFGAQGQAESVEQQQAFCLLVPLWESPAGRAQATGNDECKSRAAASDQLISRNTLLYIYITPYTDL